MKIKDGFVVREIAGNFIAVPTGDLVKEIGAIIYLTNASKFIWELLEKEDLTIEQIAEKLVERYKIDYDRAKKDTEKFVQQLQAAKIFAV